MNTKLYFAYGMNTDTQGMAIRCPAAKPIGVAVLKDHALTMRGVADIINAKGARVIGALWEITEPCEKALDRLESFPSYYDKKNVQVEIDGEIKTAMVYQMQPENQNRTSPASLGYYRTLETGYKEFGIPIRELVEANQNAQITKRCTSVS